MQRDPINLRVLVFTPIGRDGPASAELLRRFGTPAELCASLPELVEEIAAGAAAVFVAEEGLYGKDLSALTRWIGSQPPWSDLPFVVLTSSQLRPRIVQWRQHLVKILHNVTFLERPVQAITLTSTMESARRARFRQYEIQSLLEAREEAALRLEEQVNARTGELSIANEKLRAQMAERARVEEALRQSQKIEAIGQLTGGVAHDFNNLLMVISGGLEMLERRDDAARRGKIIEGMRQAAQRGTGLTRQLLAFARRQPLNPQPTDIARQIGGMRELLDRSLRGDVHVKLEFAADLWIAEVDPGELELVVLNLAVNARDAMPNGGTIIIRGENVPADDMADLAGEYVRLSIIDSGIGMTPEVKAHVFEPFFTTKEIGKGSGLGLAQAHGFAVQSGGTVRIESELGRGTSVILLLPRSVAPVSAGQAHLAALTIDRESASVAGRVLLVEDDEEVATLVTEMLDHLGYEVVHVSSAAAALGALANERPIDVLLSDIMMPGGMNGVELAREVRMRRPDIPILLTSGYPQSSERDAGSEGLHILHKPYRLTELAEALDKTCKSG